MSPSRRRFASTPHHDMTITSKVRTALMEDEHYDLVAEQLVDSMRNIESMARVEIKKLQDRVFALESERTEFLKESGVIRVLEARRGKSVREWLKWGVRKLLPWLGALIFGGLCYAFKGMHPT